MNVSERKLVLDVLARAVDITVATNRQDGWPQATTVSFVSDGLVIYFGTGSKSQKAANISRDSRVSVTATAPYQSWDGIRGFSLAGNAEFVTDPKEIARIGELMMKRFGGELAKVAPADFGETCFVKISPKLISILDYSKGFGHTDLVTAGVAELAA